MLYYLFEYLEKQYQFPGASLFGFITFRAAVAIILSLLISTIYGKQIIRFLQKKFVCKTHTKNIKIFLKKPKKSQNNLARFL